MMALPPALRPWALELGLLQEDLALTLGPWLPRLAQAIGPLAASSLEGPGQPDGYGGLARRGPYERLLMSEWLLAEELPLEFLRRASTHEHLFFDLRRQEQAGSRRTVALFDAGPMQLGTPRLVHLAMLLLLARRAAQGRAAFTWGVLQDPTCELHGEPSADVVQRLLNARSIHEADPARIAAWIERLGQPQPGQDTWLIGDRILCPLAAQFQASVLTIEDPLEPLERFLCAKVQRAGASQAVPHSVELRLPSDRDCVRLLRNPFETGRSSVVSPIRDWRPTCEPGSLLLCQQRVCIRQANGDLIFHSFPNSPAATPGKPRRFVTPPGERVLAVSRRDRRMLVLTQLPGGEDSLRFHLYGAGNDPGSYPSTHNGYTCRTVELLHPEHQHTHRPTQSDPSGPLQLLVAGKEVGAQPPELAFVLPGPVGVRIPSQPDGPAHAAWYPGIRQLVRRSEQLLYSGTWDADRATSLADCVCVGRLSPGAPRTLVRQAIRDPDRADAFVSRGGNFGRVLIAISGDGLRWRLTDGADCQEELQLPDNLTVIGVLEAPERPGLVVLEPDRREISFISRQASRSICKLADELVEFCVSTHAPYITTLSRAGELRVHTLHHARPLLQVLPGGLG